MNRFSYAPVFPKQQLFISLSPSLLSFIHLLPLSLCLSLFEAPAVCAQCPSRQSGENH